MRSDRPEVTGFFDPATNSVSYIVADPQAKVCAIVDPVLDYDASGGRTHTRSADRLLAAAAANGLKVALILETHVHADHLSAAAYLRQATGAPVAIGADVVGVQQFFGRLFAIESTIRPGGADFDRLIADGEAFTIGTLEARALHTPGHTPACTTYVIGDAAFVGDTLFMPDYGTARCDFPGGDAATLYRSIHRILSLPEDTRIFVAHDYAPGGRAIAWETTVKLQREQNIHVRQGIGEADYVAMRTARDRTLSLPALILPAVQVNIRAGALPPPDGNGTSYLKIPLDRF
jgi:glyoxylase-like metal-dependent hydrolase (beta-lactamase superfamily II)